MKMRHGTALLAGIALPLLAIAALQAAERTHVGQWEFVSTVDGQSTTRNYCIKPAQVVGINGDAAADRAFLEKGAAAHHCTIKDFKLVGGHHVLHQGLRRLHLLGPHDVPAATLPKAS